MPLVPLILVIASTAVSASSPSFRPNALQAVELAPNQYELTLTHHEILNAERAQRVIFIGARQLCADRTVTLGEYRQESQVAIGSKTSIYKFIQQVACGSAEQLTADDLATRALSDEQRVAIESTVRELTVAYLDSQSKQKSGAESGRHIESITAASLPRQDLNTRKGRGEPETVKSRELWRVSIYPATGDSDLSGVRAVVEFMQGTKRIPVQCGHIVWQERRDGSFVISNERTQNVTRAELKKLSPDELNARKQAFGCKP